MNGKATCVLWLKRAAIAGFVGAILGAFIFWVVDDPSILKWIVLGGVCGMILGSFWPICHSFVLRLRVHDWQLQEVEIQGLRFTSGGAQRRVAWRLFVEIITRIATQPLDDEVGDDGVALKSLYDLFQFTRKTVAEMEITASATGETIETFALDMLNGDLRPFLSKWHPLWDEFAKGDRQPSQVWSYHKPFRNELRQLQSKIEMRARGLAEIAGVKNVNRFFSQNAVNRV
jgi:hypothetical protein